MSIFFFFFSKKIARKIKSENDFFVYRAVPAGQVTGRMPSRGKKV
jgi:hypothetical protein